MDIVFFLPEQRAGQTAESRSSEQFELMSSVRNQIEHSLVEADAAANADLLDEAGQTSTKGIETTGSWDAYDVWRRFIKEARDRRKGQNTN